MYTVYIHTYVYALYVLFFVCCKFGKFSHLGRVTSKVSTCITDDSYKTGSAYTGRVVNGRIARAAS